MKKTLEILGSDTMYFIVLCICGIYSLEIGNYPSAYFIGILIMIRLFIKYNNRGH